MKIKKFNILMVVLLVIGLFWGFIPFVKFIITKHYFFNNNSQILFENFNAYLIGLYAKWQIPTFFGFVGLFHGKESIKLTENSKLFIRVIMSIIALFCFAFSSMTYDLPLSTFDKLVILFGFNFIFLNFLIPLKDSHIKEA